ncbi:MAG: mechanosensitive ion channel [Solirubrobacterales bacterium]|nr:mechanosensitive ion channel [Solirubrobacterales bacterium]MBV9716441.1 mechanosensitive ion channel [Solirubrobacterales bacterium]
MTTATIIDHAGQSLGAFLPRLGGALVLLVIGIIVARILGRLLTRALQRIGLDTFADRHGVHDVLARAGLGRSLARVTGRAIRIALTLVVIFAALSLLGMQFLSASLNRGVLLLPQLLVAAALLLVGIVLGGFVRERVDRVSYQMALPIPLGLVAQVVVVAIFLVTAAAQISISTAMLLTVLGVTLAGVAAALAIAFGLGGREVARALSAGRYIRSDYTVGQEITVADVRGRITAIDGTSITLDAGSGRSVRVPNHLLLETVVTTHEVTPEP